MKKNEEGDRGKSGNNGTSDGRILNGLNRRAGERNRRLTCHCEYHSAPQRPQRYSWEETKFILSVLEEAFAPMDSPISVQNDRYQGELDQKGNCEQSCSATLDLGGQFVCVRKASVVVLDTGAAANLFRLKWIANHNSFFRET